MREMGAEIERVLLHPQLVRRSRSDHAVRLFYEFYAQTIVGGKWLCVVVKYWENDAFVVTAYLTDKPKTGEDLWPIKLKSGSMRRRISLQSVLPTCAHSVWRGKTVKSFFTNWGFLRA